MQSKGSVGCWSNPLNCFNERRQSNLSCNMLYYTNANWQLQYQLLKPILQIMQIWGARKTRGAQIYMLYKWPCIMFEQQTIASNCLCTGTWNTCQSCYVIFNTSSQRANMGKLVLDCQPCHLIKCRGNESLQKSSIFYLWCPWHNQTQQYPTELYML